MPRTPKPWFYRRRGWWMAYLGGKKVRLAKGKKNRAAAAQVLRELLVEADKNPPPDEPQQTVASVIETYLSFATKRLSTGTLDRRIPYLQSFAEEHGFRLIRHSKPFHMEAWLDNHPEWKSDWTKNGALRNVQAAFNWAWRKGVIDANPFRGVVHRAGLPRRDLKRDEFQALLRATRGKVYKKRPSPGARFRQILIFLWYTGCRPHEASELTWDDVNFDDEVIVLKEHKTVRTQRIPRPRVIPLDPVVVKLLRFIQRYDQPAHRVFLTYRLTPWDRYSLGHRIRRARKAAGLPDDAKLYGIRHAFGTRGVMNDCDLKTLSALMGHTTTRMTEYYVHLAGQREHLAAAMRRVNGRDRGA